ncbi:uncharacterized protein LOC126560871 [Anopheles maculipalpis]|uniref:uncharacterized protein LOC126560871 n=1 Tax=Anopheles maculipalpis TaxID=1496333 RepID=UPI002159A7FB|nr:uncharacterized protein LOC126560871 [Anopheles maculipalpis]
MYIQQDTAIEPTSQPSIDRESVTSSEEYFRLEVLKATSTHTPGRTVERRTTNTNRPPPPSTAAADRVQRFIFKLNSIILSDIEERVDEDGSIVRQLERNPDRVVELLSKSSLETSDNEDDDHSDGVAKSHGTVNTRKARRKMPNGIRRQQSISLDDTADMNPCERTKTHPGDLLSQRDESLDQEQEMVLLRDIPPAVRLRALMRFKSLDASDRTISTERNGRRRMKSVDTIDANEEDEQEEEDEKDDEADCNTFHDVPYDPEEEERICAELLEELRQLEQADRNDVQPVVDNEPQNVETMDNDQSIARNDDGHKTAWEKLQDYLQRVPKRRSSNYDLFYESDEDTLKTLFKRHKLKLLFHYSDSSSEASDDTL